MQQFPGLTRASTCEWVEVGTSRVESRRAGMKSRSHNYLTAFTHDNICIHTS